MLHYKSVYRCLLLPLQTTEIRLSIPSKKAIVSKKERKKKSQNKQDLKLLCKLELELVQCCSHLTIHLLLTMPAASSALVANAISSWKSYGTVLPNKAANKCKSAAEHESHLLASSKVLLTCWISGLASFHYHKAHFYIFGHITSVKSRFLICRTQKQNESVPRDSAQAKTQHTSAEEQQLTIRLRNCWQTYE